VLPTLNEGRARDWWRSTVMTRLMGARPMARLIQESIKRLLAEADSCLVICEHGGTVHISLRDAEAGAGVLEEEMGLR